MVVNIEFLSVVNKEIVLSMPHDHSRAQQGDVSSYIDVNPNKWVSGEVVKVLKGAIHVRPAYHDTPGKYLPLFAFVFASRRYFLTG